MSRLREEELRVVRLLHDASEAFEGLHPEHPADKQDFDAAIRAAQNIVLARVGARSARKGTKAQERRVGFG